MRINGDAWAAAFLASEPQYTQASWIDTYATTFGGCRPDLTPGQVMEAAHLAFFREGTWNNPKVAAGMDALFGAFLSNPGAPSRGVYRDRFERALK